MSFQARAGLYNPESQAMPCVRITMKTNLHTLPVLAAAVALMVSALEHHCQAASTRDLDRDGIPNLIDPDIDNDGIPNGLDRNVDGGIARSGPLKGRYIGDRINNDGIAETDIDDDDLRDDALSEKDIDGDHLADDSASEKDIDGDGRADDHPSESDIDGDGRADDSPDELDIDGDGLNDDSGLDDDIDGDGRHSGLDDDDDGDNVKNARDDDADGDGHQDRHTGTDDVKPDDHGTATPSTPVNGGSAPSVLTGLAFLVSENATELPERIELLSAATGRKIEGADIDGFTYTYAASGSTATLHLQFKPDRWHDYSLNFATGVFTRAEFDKNTLKDTDTGSFTAVP